MSRIPSPQNDKRGCLCKNGKYSRKCCDGTLQAQGIGNITEIRDSLLQETAFKVLQEDNSKINL
jgi:hypothetical protein|tara:strand:+ start:245 stop:436 length:192 start_codon:yes stop_codon:yes gene_type:complete